MMKSFAHIDNMVRPKIKVLQLVLGLLLILFLVTNPSKNDFDDFIGLTSMNNVLIVSTRERNYFLFSHYKVTMAAFGQSDADVYLGLLGNFFLVEGKGKSKELDKIQ